MTAAFNDHAARGKPGASTHRPRRMRVHRDCQLATDEALGLSAPPSDAQCARCRRPLGEVGVVVQLFVRP